MKSFIFYFYTILALNSFCVNDLNAEVLVGRASVIDGDTFKINKFPIRLHGIDAPETDQSCHDQDGKPYRCGELAKTQMVKYTKGKTVTCNINRRDRYKRLIGVCYAGNQDLNGLLVSDGLALAYRQYSKKYIEAENIAKLNKVGLWQGSFVKPWDWRKGKRLVKESTKHSGKCMIKGNISSSGKIYHTPSSPWYKRTKINTGKGERWFCSEEDAKAAGWRPPKR